MFAKSEQRTRRRSAVPESGSFPAGQGSIERDERPLGCAQRDQDLLVGRGCGRGRAAAPADQGYCVAVSAGGAAAAEPRCDLETQPHHIIGTSMIFERGERRDLDGWRAAAALRARDRSFASRCPSRRAQRARRRGAPGRRRRRGTERAPARDPRGQSPRPVRPSRPSLDFHSPSVRSMDMVDVTRPRPARSGWVRPRRVLCLR
jgi:hypothetical protein